MQIVSLEQILSKWPSDVLLLALFIYGKTAYVKHIIFYCVWGYMFRSLCDQHQAFLRIKSINAGYMLGSQLCLQLVPVYYI